ncbi:phosphorylase family protein, partial [Streptomyces lasiicapitis]
MTGTAPRTRLPGPRVLIATAVPAERDAVASGLSGATAEGAPAADLLVAGVGPASAAAATAHALATAAAGGTPYDLVVSAGIGGGFKPAAPVGSLVVADAITVADLGAETPDGFLPVTELGFGR